MVHVYECGLLTRSSSKGRVYCYHQFMHYCMSICLRCTHKLFSNSQRQHVGIIVFFLTKTCNYVLSFFIFFPTNSSGIVLDMMSTLMKLTAAQRPSQTFLRLVSEASSCGSWLRPRRELIVFLAPRDLQRSTTTRTNTPIHLRRLLSSMAPLHESHQNCL